jgi:FMN phosphatase YigB (HAD superfamily)
MPLSLEQYVERLDERTELPWPIAPRIEPLRAKPHLKKVPARAVMWTVYGTLVAIPQGEILFEHPQEFVTDAAFDKVIKEFKMWNSMSRKPGAPSAYMRELFTRTLTPLKMLGSGGEKHPEVRCELVWEDIVKKLFQKEYQFDAVMYGSLNEYARKIAYFYHASIQGTGPYPGAAETVRGLHELGKSQGLLADGQCFTPGQLQRCLRKDDPEFSLDRVLPANLRILSAERKARKPSDTLFKAAVDALGERGIRPGETLHVGSNLLRDIVPARKYGFRTALFAGDRNSLVADNDQLNNPATRPDVLLTERTQLLDVIGS